ncbi:unnamed protein product [Brachionus calyciflorus]|uniref:EGF-like domain-containing protein n=1 Tax=Brachionus calyciflorus TaxID=104777 RepID=A0A814F549_9BILA|nr:unnamed protein product [Brachionus calyciflorus]
MTVIQSYWGERKIALAIKRYNITSKKSDNLIEKWETSGSTKQIKQSNEVTCFAILSETYMASGQIDGVINIWKILDMSLFKSIKYHSDKVNSIIKINNKLFASGSDDKTIIIYNLTDFSQVRKINDTDNVKYLRLLNETTIAGVTFYSCCSKTIKFWDIKLYIYKTQISIRPWSDFFELVENGFLAFFVIDNNYYVYIYNPEIHVVQYSFTIKVGFNSLFYHNNLLFCGYSDGQIEVWNKNIRNTSFKVESSFVKSFDSINEIIAISYSNSKIVLINSTSFLLIKTIYTNLDILNCFIFVKNSSIIEQSYLVNKNLMPTSLSTIIAIKQSISSDAPLQKFTSQKDFYQDLDFKKDEQTSSNYEEGTTMFEEKKTDQNTKRTISSNSHFSEQFSTLSYDHEYLNISVQNSFKTSMSQKIDSSIYLLNNQTKIIHPIDFLENFSIVNFTKFAFSSLKEELVINLIQTEIDLIDCFSNCSNRGSCVLKTNKRFTCSCLDSFRGDSCQFDSRKCSLSPCLNNGTCIDLDSELKNDSFSEISYFCQCDQFHLGKNCEIKKDICENETCSGNGYCFNFENRPKCKCYSMYLGDKCNYESNYIKTVKTMIRSSSIVAIFVIITFLALFPIFDILSRFKIPSKQQRAKIKIKQNF